MESTVINCECLCHSLHIKSDIYYKTVDISLWNYGFSDGKLSWKNRFKILKDGFAYSDLVILNSGELDKLIEALQKAREEIA